MLAGLEAIQQVVVVSDDPFKGERSYIGRHVSVCHQRYIVTQTDSTANCGVDAVLRPAAGNDEAADLASVKFGR